MIVFEKNKPFFLVTRILLLALIAIASIACRGGSTNKNTTPVSTVIESVPLKNEAESIREWDTWLQQNDKYSISLYGTVTPEHAWAINSLCNMS